MKDEYGTYPKSSQYFGELEANRIMNFFIVQKEHGSWLIDNQTNCLPHKDHNQDEIQTKSAVNK